MSVWKGKHSHEEPHVQHESCQGDCSSENEDLIFKDGKFAVNDLVANKLSTMIEQCLYHTLWTSMYYA